MYLYHVLKFLIIPSVMCHLQIVPPIVDVSEIAVDILGVPLGIPSNMLDIWEKVFLEYFGLGDNGGNMKMNSSHNCKAYAGGAHHLSNVSIDLLYRKGARSKLAISKVRAQRQIL